MLTLFSPEESLAATADALACLSAAVSPNVELAALRKAIRKGGDPLGETFIHLRSPKTRRISGAVYTPPVLVSSMINWARDQSAPDIVVDPGAGSGRFLIAAAHAFPAARLIAVETDPLAVKVLRANIAVHGLQDRTVTIEDDYRSANLPPTRGKKLFIGNPPYVRHHDIAPPWKTWYKTTAARFGIKASALAGLHLHFFLRTLQLASPGDIGAFVTSAEWMDVNYGDALRRLLVEQLGCVAVHVLEPAAMPFAGTTTTGAITCFQIGTKAKTIRMHSVPSIHSLNALTAGAEVPRDQAAATNRWSVLLRPPEPRVSSDLIELGEIVRVSRGQVTGHNDVWIAGPAAKGLPGTVLEPTVTRARELIAAGDALDERIPLRQVVNLPVDLDEIDAADRKYVERFIAWARMQGADNGYVATHRRAWWAVGLYEPAPMVCTYMARRPPAFVRNLRGARHLNIAHGLYPRKPMTEDQMSKLLAYLRVNLSQADGRTYAGGLTKFEPRELERTPVPRLDALDDFTTQMDRS